MFICDFSATKQNNNLQLSHSVCTLSVFLDFTPHLKCVLALTPGGEGLHPLQHRTQNGNYIVVVFINSIHPSFLC